MTTYTQKHKEYYLKNRERILSLRAERERLWMLTPKGKFSVQKRKAKSRGIDWYLTFDQWWDIWEKSGQWDRRGDKAGQYCMSRFNDTGPYIENNVYINEFSNNTLESYQRLGVDEAGRFQSTLVARYRDLNG